MIIRTFLTLLILTACGVPLHGAITREELVSEVNAALDTHDKAAFEKCFNHDGATEDFQRAFTDIEEKIFSLPTHYVYAEERIDKGKMHFAKDGKNYTLNGDWLFDIGIYISKPPSPRGYVLPAGMANGKCQLLITTEDKP